MTVELDTSQQAAAHVPPSARQVVVAGPGSGKTEVVAALVENLVAAHDLEPDTDLLVISFSRAAVRAVSRRLKDADVRASAAVRTLDALAAQIVTESTERDITGMSFDARITCATEVLRCGDWEAADDIRHLVVDEVQDVVGLRAELLLALIGSLDQETGFTLLGDPAQAIYDFQLRSPSDITGSELLRRLTAAGDVPTRHLTGSYRALTRDARLAVALREDGAIDLADRFWPVREFVEDLVTVEDMDELLPLLTSSESTAVLTATNGEALLLAYELWDRGVRATIRRRATDPVVDRWVAGVLTDRSSWSREEFLATQEIEAVGRERWKALRTLVRPQGGVVDTSAVASALGGRRAVPGELLAVDDEGPVVSTIHRAKGLEFDSVVVAQYPPRPDDERDDDERTRLLYVAVTRARARIFRISRQRTFGLQSDPLSDRWVRTGKGGKGTTRYELRGSDLDRTEPPGDEQSRDVQEHLSTRVRTGDLLTMALDPYHSSLDEPVYSVFHEGVLVGRTGTDFAVQFARQVGTARHRKPDTLPWPGLTGAHVEAVETVAGSPQRERKDDVGHHGLWLGVRPVGLMHLKWWSDK